MSKQNVGYPERGEQFFFQENVGWINPLQSVSAIVEEKNLELQKLPTRILQLIFYQ
ncbi:MAG: hypothetical protein AAGF96_01890 [Bacteroidota bacterium]